MGAPLFISRKVRLRSSVAVVSIAVSFTVMILSLAVSGGFKTEIHRALGDAFGDISVLPLVTPENGAPGVVCASQVEELVSGVYGVEKVRSVIYAGGMIRHDDNVHGVIFKSVRGNDSLSGEDVCVPAALSKMLSVNEGDRIIAYFLKDDRTILRNLHVSGIYESLVTDDDKFVVQCSDEMLSRVMGYGDDQASEVEVVLMPSFRDEASMHTAATDISWNLISGNPGGDDAPSLMASTVRARYPQIFSWLELIDINVDILLVLMAIVAAFNMVCALLIMLFQNISTIGVLKTLGMGTREICKSFLLSSSRTVLIAMAGGNVLGLVLCFVQARTHLIALDPANYFLSFVPVEINMPLVLLVDFAAFIFIMAALLCPCVFISSIEPSRSVDCR